MHFEQDNIYHIYNRGNNRNKIFFERKNYIFFLEKVRNHILPFCDIISYCLMPDHFHFLIKANHKTIENKIVASKEKNVLSENIRVMLSSYTRAINKQKGFVGSLFQQNTKAVKLNKHYFITSGQRQFYHDDVFTCFAYIHQNPYEAKLVDRFED